MYYVRVPIYYAQYMFCTVCPVQDQIKDEDWRGLLVYRYPGTNFSDRPPLLYM